MPCNESKTKNQILKSKYWYRRTFLDAEFFSIYFILCIKFHHLFIILKVHIKKNYKKSINIDNL